MAEDQLRQIFTQSLNPDASSRNAAESQLKSLRTTPGHALSVLRLISTATDSPSDMPVRQAAAVHFKNLVKKGWAPDEDDESRIMMSLSEQDRTLIKNNLVDLMCTVPPQIQAQCSESIALIAATDFPAKWDNLLSDLIGKFTTSSDWNVINGVLVATNSILKRFRYVQRSDALYADILYVLQRIQEPLTKLFTSVVGQLDGVAGDPRELTYRLNALRSINRIFYSLNYQDLPEYFEDHMAEWMAGFAKLLEYKNPLLVDSDEEVQPGPIDDVQVSVVQNLNLYGNKDEEPFIPYLPQFTKLVWDLLMTVTPMSKHDALATTSIRFLSSLIGKLMHRSIFQDEATLREILTRIVIPNLTIREVDEEKFEDDPAEFILGDMEGSDSESRRKCTQEMLRAMCRQFEGQTTAIVSEHVGSMLQQYQADPANQWKMKDVAIHLMLGVAVRAESAQFGVSQINDGVNVMDFFSKHVYSELQETDMSVRPMVKATCIKFVTTFRQQFGKEQIVGLMPLLIAHLGSGDVVVHTYAAAAIEKILTAKVDGPGGVKVTKITGSDLKPFLGGLFTALFGIVDNEDLNENEYVMKCIMRTLNVARDDLMDVVQVVLEKLTDALGRVAKNPKNPQYNHFLFESIAVLIRAVCTKDASSTTAFEQFLFPPFQMVLQMEVVEFTPYVFQLLAQILEFRPEGAGLGEAYTSLFAPLLTPQLWERRGNVPALTRLLTAYLSKGASEIVLQLEGLLGVFQKLISSKANEAFAFDLLRGIVIYMPQEKVLPYMKQIFQILMMKLQAGKTPKYVGLVTHFFALFIGKCGSQVYMDQLNALQPGLGLMLMTQVWIPRLQQFSPTRLEAKTQVVGLTKLLCETPALLSDPNGQQIWGQALACAVKIVCSPESHLNSLSAEGNDDDVEIGYDATFSLLHFATRPSRDPFPEVADASTSLIQGVGLVSSSSPGQLTPILAQCLQDPKLRSGFDALCQKAGVQL